MTMLIRNVSETPIQSDDGRLNNVYNSIKLDHLSDSKKVGACI